MVGFERKRSSVVELDSIGLLGADGVLDNKQLERIKTIRNNWNFYEGFHWEDVQPTGKPEITFNYCRAFCDKFVSFELGKSFTIKLDTQEEVIVTDEPYTIDKDDEKVAISGRTLFEYLSDVWIDNKQNLFCSEMGIMKSVTGEAWVQVTYQSPDELDDPFEEYPNGRIKVSLKNTGNVFPEYDPHDKDKLVKLTLMYPIEEEEKTFYGGRKSTTKVIFKQVWTKDMIQEFRGAINTANYPNPYSTIPFIQIRNISVANKEYGKSDLEDLIPLNVEYNLKASDVSEILDYHASPVTILFGAKQSSIEKGANKMWGGIPKDARVENLELKSDLTASTVYLANIKKAMCEVAGIPEQCLGGEQNISNTSGIALHYINLPLIDKTNIKKASTENALETINKLIILISLREGLITNPNNVPLREFCYNEVTIPDTLPKDMLIEMQQIQAEMAVGLESRKGAMARLGRENIDAKLDEIDEDMEKNPALYGLEVTPELNSGMTNGEDTQPLVKKKSASNLGENIPLNIKSADEIDRRHR